MKTGANPSERGAGADTPKAKRSLGQNFLRDPNIARKIVSALHVGPEDTVVEIGPGPGALTAFLREIAPKRLVLIEKDGFWATERMRDGVPVILADALSMAWERFNTPWKCIGNLPYNVASPLMWDIVSLSPGLTRAVFMIQKEVGLRVTAQPGGSAYGALSVWIQSYMVPKLEFIVPPHVFRPAPKVDSAVVSFVPLRMQVDRGEAAVSAFEPTRLARTLKACFQMRRKQLGTIVTKAGHDPRALERLGIDPKLRPEKLAPADFHRLSGSGIF